jgi:hypothetical protein
MDIWNFTSREHMHLVVALQLPSGLCNGNNLLSSIGLTIIISGTTLCVEIFLPPNSMCILNLESVFNKFGKQKQLILVIVHNDKEEMGKLANMMGSKNMRSVTTFSDINYPFRKMTTTLLKYQSLVIICEVLV